MREESEGISGRASGQTGSEGERGELGWGAPVMDGDRGRAVTGGGGADTRVPPGRGRERVSGLGPISFPGRLDGLDSGLGWPSWAGLPLFFLFFFFSFSIFCFELY